MHHKICIKSGENIKEKNILTVINIVVNKSYINKNVKSNLRLDHGGGTFSIVLM